MNVYYFTLPGQQRRIIKTLPAQVTRLATSTFYMGELLQTLAKHFYSKRSVEERNSVDGNGQLMPDNESQLKGARRNFDGRKERDTWTFIFIWFVGRPKQRKWQCKLSRNNEIQTDATRSRGKFHLSSSSRSLGSCISFHGDSRQVNFHRRLLGNLIRSIDVHRF